MAKKENKKTVSLNKKKKAVTQIRGKNKTYLVCFLVVVGSLTLFNLSLYFSNYGKKPVEARAEVVYDTSYWLKLLNEHPDYFPGWLELAKLEFANGNIESAHLALTNARKINPNSQEIKTLEYILGLNK